MLQKCRWSPFERGIQKIPTYSFLSHLLKTQTRKTKAVQDLVTAENFVSSTCSSSECTDCRCCVSIIFICSVWLLSLPQVFLLEPSESSYVRFIARNSSRQDGQRPLRKPKDYADAWTDPRIGKCLIFYYCFQSFESQSSQDLVGHERLFRRYR